MTSPVRSIDLDLLDRRADARAVDEYQVKAIANSMGDVGQLSAIRVRPKADGRFEIMAGVHRVEACRLLGLAEIDGIVEDIGELFAELTMIDENLCRSELGPADRARQTARRKQIYEEIHPETAQGSPGVSRQVGDTRERSEAPRFTEDTAQASGKSERTVQRDAERGEKISPDVLALVRGTELDTGTYLDGLKKFGPDQQRMLVERDLAALEAGDNSDAGRERARQAVGAGRVQDGESLDYFPTPPWATRALIEDVLAPNGIDLGFDLVWEPACGEGHISGVLEEYGVQVIATDIKDYSVDGRSPPGWAQVADFLEASWGEDEPPEWIVTNPPFTGREMDRALEFALRALATASRGVALFVRTGWAMEGIDRYQRLFRDNPPTLLCPFVERVPIFEGRWVPDGSSDMAYSWLVWIKGEAERTPWRIPPGRRVERSRPDDIERFTAHPVISILPASHERSADESQAAVAGETGEATAAAVSPLTALSSEAINQLIRDGYAAGGLDLVKRLAAATGLERAAVRQRAKRMGLADAQHQRDASRALMNARHHGGVADA